MSGNSPAFEDRAISVWSRRKQLGLHAQRALLSATADLTVCCLASLGRLRDGGDPLARLLADNRRLRIEIAELQCALAILRSTRENVPPRRRRHYTPGERFRIVEHMKAFLLTVEQTAQRFLVTPQTLYNWLAELRQEPGKTTIGSLSSSRSLRCGVTQTWYGAWRGR